MHPLDIDDCLGLLGRAYLGRVAFVRAGRPQVVPVNFRYHQGTVVFRTSYGALLDTVNGQHVAFEIDDAHPLDHTGWSVVVHGRAEEVSRPEELHEVRGLPLQPWAPGEREHYVRIVPSAITGRRIGPP